MTKPTVLCTALEQWHPANETLAVAARPEPRPPECCDSLPCDLTSEPRVSRAAALALRLQSGVTSFL